MRMRPLAVITSASACILVAVSGCSPYGNGVFQCTDSAQCGAGGICQTSGFCSFADTGCASGQRYGEYSGGGLSGRCVDEGPGSDGGPTDDGGGVPGLVCNAADTTLVACFRFEGNLDDESSYGNTPASSDETFEAGIDRMAVRTRATTELPITDNASFDVATLTIETWLRADEVPATGRAGLIDVNGQYGAFILPGGDLLCSVSGRQTTASAAVVPGTWTHFACTYDDAAVVIYVDGQVAAMTPATGMPNVNANDSVSLAGNAPTGDPFIGLMDDFRLWSIARSPADICAAAGCAAR